MKTTAFILLVSTLAFVSAARLGNAATLKAGVASTDITPPTGFPMWGYGGRHDAPSVGVLDPLYANAVVLDAGTTLALVGLDLGRSPTPDSMARIRDAVKNRAGVETVMIVGSHTHHGPVIETNDWPSPDAPYSLDLENKLIDAIVKAATALQPAKIGAASKSVEFNRNRHWKGDDPPADSSLNVIRIDTAEDAPLAVLVNFAAHPTMLPAEKMDFSADYPGHLKRRVEEATGAACAFFQGAAGDLSVNSKEKGPEGYGRALGAEAVALWREIETVAPESVEINAAEDDFAFESRTDFSSSFVRALYASAFYKGIVDAVADEFADGIHTRLTTAVIDSDSFKLAFVGVSGEPFCNHALRLKARSPVPTLVFGYCNGHQLYFPTIEAAAQGGYGGAPEVAPVEVGAGERMFNRALIRIFALLANSDDGRRR